MAKTIRIWESAGDWGGDITEEERDALNAGYEAECYARLCEAFPGAEIDHTVDYSTSGDRRVRGADAGAVGAILDAVWESMCEQGVL